MPRYALGVCVLLALLGCNKNPDQATAGGSTLASLVSSKDLNVFRGYSEEATPAGDKSPASCFLASA